MSADAREPVLVVDDDALFRRLLEVQLEGAGYQVRTAVDGQSAREALEDGTFALVLCDLHMPGETGIELLADVLAEDPDLVAIVVSGEDDPATADAAAEAGVWGYMVKPFSEKQLLINVANALRARTLRIENRAYREHLEVLVDERTAALDDALAHLGRLAEELNASREETVRRLSIAGEYRDGDTGEHVSRVAWLTEVLARGMGLEGERCELLRMASPLHDIGKVGIPDSILRKAGALDADERAVMQMHAEIGRQILTGSESPMLDLAATVAWTHHEHFDGSGYPRGLGGGDIPLEGRIVAVADVFDALTHDRVYRRRFPADTAIEQVTKGRGTHFDPDVVDVFLACEAELRSIAEGTVPDLGPRVLIVEPDDQVRLRLERVLRGEGCDIVGAVVTAAHGFSLIHTKRPDVAVVDVDGAAPSGIDLTRRLALEPGGPRVLLYTQDGVPRGLEMVAGVAAKGNGATELPAAVREVAAGRSFFEGRFSRAEAPVPLSPREREILTLLARGHSSDEVAGELFLSPETVRTHLRNAMTKLSAHSRLHAVTEALRRHEISL
jgi:putative two-component system response regulator